MKAKKLLAAVFSLAVLAITPTSCIMDDEKAMCLVNEQTCSLTGIEAVDIAYSVADVKVLTGGDNNTLVLKEFMTNNEERYHARITTSGKHLIIESGERAHHSVLGFNFGTSIRVRAELYLPAQMAATLAVTTVTGDIDIPQPAAFTDLRLQTTTGDIVCNDVACNNADIKVITGDVRCRTSVSNNVSISTATGDVTCQSTTSASVRISTSAGDIRATLEQPANVSFSTSAGDVHLYMPRTMQGEIALSSSTGDIRLPSDAVLTNVRNGRHSLIGTLGNGDNDIRISSSTGDVVVEYNQ